MFRDAILSTLGTILDVMTGVLGGGTGIALCLLSAQVIAAFFPLVPVAVTWDSILLAFVFSAAVGVISGVYPAWKAARLDPIAALRGE